jgi:hypothetical protein
MRITVKLWRSKKYGSGTAPDFRLEAEFALGSHNARVTTIP